MIKSKIWYRSAIDLSSRITQYILSGSYFKYYSYNYLTSCQGKSAPFILKKSQSLAS